MHGKAYQKLKITGSQLRGLMLNQIGTPYFAYRSDQRNKMYTLADFENKKPTHMIATHAISKSERNFQNQIPRRLDKILTESLSILKNACIKKLRRFLVPKFKLRLELYNFAANFQTSLPFQIYVSRFFDSAN